jgi:hypothetical protein
LREFNACKDAALSADGAGVGTAAELQALCLGNDPAGLPDTAGKVAKTCAKIQGTIQKKCEGRGIQLPVAFPTYLETHSGPIDPQKVYQAVHRGIDCAVCTALNHADLLRRNCDLLDNGTEDGSCISGISPSVTVGVAMTAPLYAPADPKVATATIASMFPLIANVLVTLTESSAPGVAVFEQTIPVSLPTAGSVEVPIDLDVQQVGSYRLRVEVRRDLVLADAVEQFGVRPSTPILPPDVLKATIASPDVGAIRAALDAAGTAAISQAASGTSLAATTLPPAVEIDLAGSLFAVRVTSADDFELDPGECVPQELAAAKHYEGDLAICIGGAMADSACTADGDCPGGLCGTEPDSEVEITIGPDDGTADGNDIYVMIVRGSGDVFFGEPLNLFDAGATPDSHAFYWSQDVRLPGHDVHSMLSSVRTAANAQVAQIGAATGAGTGEHHSIVVRVRLYEHKESNRRTRRRKHVFRAWKRIVTSEFRNVRTRRAMTNAHLDDETVTVERVSSASWKAISAANYNVDCFPALDRFSEVGQQAHRNYILFTTKPTGCGGVAELGQGTTQTAWHSLVVDSGSMHDAIVILGQEVGHNWDWHLQWNSGTHPDCSSDDDNPLCAHLASVIHEQWIQNNQWNCTMMGATYGPCGAGARIRRRYHRSSVIPLAHLAEGLVQTFVTASSNNTPVASQGAALTTTAATVCGPECSSCGNGILCDGATSSSCVRVCSTEGTAYCHLAASCNPSLSNSCATSGDCTAGEVCVVNTCCGRYCLPVSNCGTANASGAVASGCAEGSGGLLCAASNAGGVPDF